MKTSLKRTIKSNLNKANFALKRSPIVLHVDHINHFIPMPYQAVILISADFELAWSSRYDKSVDTPLKKAVALAERERLNIPAILNICDKYNIPITWATVGHLFLAQCAAINGTKHPEIPGVSPYKGVFWDFQGDNWFEHDPCTDYVHDPLWYSPDLIKKILQAQVKHEIACHTFSHIDCRDGVCSPELMKAELLECKRLAAEYDLKLSSFVHPGYTIGNLDILAQEGFTNFRTDYRNVLGYPKKHESNLWELEQTAEFVFRKEWSIDYHIWRYIEIIKRALKSKTICVFWFHPSFDRVVVEKILPSVFKFINEQRNLIWITTHGEYINWLNEQNIT